MVDIGTIHNRWIIERGVYTPTKSEVERFDLGLYRPDEYVLIVEYASGLKTGWIAQLRRYDDDWDRQFLRAESMTRQLRTYVLTELKEYALYEVDFRYRSMRTARAYFIGLPYASGNGGLMYLGNNAEHDINPSKAWRMYRQYLDNLQVRSQSEVDSEGGR